MRYAAALLCLTLICAGQICVAADSGQPPPTAAKARSIGYIVGNAIGLAAPRAFGAFVRSHRNLRDIAPWTDKRPSSWWSKNGDMTLSFAVLTDDLPLVDACAKHSVGVNEVYPARSGLTPLILAAALGKLGMVEHLVKLGADVNVTASGFDAISVATRQSIMAFLMSNEAKPSTAAAKPAPVDQAGPTSAVAASASPNQFGPPSCVDVCAAESMRRQ